MSGNTYIAWPQAAGARLMVKVTDLSGLKEAMDDPFMQDTFAFAKALAGAERRFFARRKPDPEMVIRVAMTMVQAAVRELPLEDRDHIVRAEVIDRMHWFLDFLDGIGAPSEGSA